MRFLLTTILAALLAGCTFTLVGNAPKTEDSIAHSKTVNASFLLTKQPLNTCSDPKEGLAAIRFHTNPAYLAVSLLSLGLYVPQNVTWWCSSEPKQCKDGDDSGDCKPYQPESN